ncbi:MAG: TolC family protein [Planctomycetales bacterium]|nr:TolC family protein [Planctomycetales bacterium]
MLLGCSTRPGHPNPPRGGAAFLGVPQEITYAAAQPAPPQRPAAPPPWTLRSDAPPEYWDLSLEEAVRLALHHSQVVRDLGGRVVEAPAANATHYGPALAQSNPRTGEEAALSAFDAQVSTSLFWAHDERTLNNVLFGGGVAGLIQNTRNFAVEYSKTAATGTRLALRNLTRYNQDNAGALNRFPSSWETTWEGEVRHPLLQGGGLEFNRIAGPNAQPGLYNGVLLARVNTDVAAVDFEIAIRNLVRDVELTYWELYFAYREFDARSRGRDAARETWQVVRDKLSVGEEDEEREALASEQYFTAQAAVEESLSGNSLSNATTGGVYGVERRLRWLMGQPPTGPALLRPVDEPSRVDVQFPWEEIHAEAQWRRAELRRQEWEIKRSELELTAARNFLKARLDVVGQYRFRGFGNELVGGHRPNSSAVSDLLTGDLQGGQIGVELSRPVGNRIGHTAVQHAQLQLRRQRDIHREQSLRVEHEVSHAYGQLARSYQLTRTNYNRSQAAIRQWSAISRKYEAGVQEPGAPEILLENVLAAQSRAVVATTAYHRSLVDYNQALMSVHLAKGTLLDYHQVYLSEGPHSPAAMTSAHRTASRLVPRELPCLQIPAPIESGPYEQRHLAPSLDLDGLRLEVAPEVPAVDIQPLEEELLPAPLSSPD